MNSDEVRGLFRTRGAGRDILGIAIGSALVFAVSARFDLLNTVLAWLYRHDTWQLDEFFTVALYLVAALIVYSRRRRRELLMQMRRREEAEERSARLLPELERARGEAAVLRSILPICSSCKRVRDDKGNWHQVDTYMEIHYLARLDGGFCPECARSAYAHSAAVRTGSGRTPAPSAGVHSDHP